MRRRSDPLERVIESALEPERFIHWRAARSFVSGLEECAKRIEGLAASDPGRAAALFETFRAGCYAKADEVDDSGGDFGRFVGGLFGGWIRARQAAGADPDETARLLLARMADDPYGFAHGIEDDVAKTLDRRDRRAFDRAVRVRLEAAGATAEDERAWARHRWGDVLRALHQAGRDPDKYAEVCAQTELTPRDCAVMATLLRAKGKPQDALAWVERGLALEPSRSPGSGLELHDLKRALLERLGRADEARESAWAEFQAHPHRFTYEELMRYVPRRDRARWRDRAMAAAETGELADLIELWLATREITRLVERLRGATDAQLERLSHFATEPAAKRLARSHPDVAGKLYRALGLRIVNEGKSRYYAAALSHFREARRCLEKAGRHGDWEALAAQVRHDHRRKTGFMPAFERLASGTAPRREPSFLQQARRRWSARS